MIANRVVQLVTQVLRQQNYFHFYIRLVISFLSLQSKWDCIIDAVAAELIMQSFYC